MIDASVDWQHDQFTSAAIPLIEHPMSFIGILLSVHTPP
jgi:hypothetical protein